MSTEYVGFDSYTVSITVVTDDDEFDAASVAVAIQQIADRTAYLKARLDGGLGFEFTDAILHGDTTLPDGTLDADLTNLDIAVVGSGTIATTVGLSIAAAGAELFLGGNNVSLQATTTVAIGGTSCDILSGQLVVSPTLIDLTADVRLGVNSSDTITVRGALDVKSTSLFEDVATFSDVASFDGGATFLDDTLFTGTNKTYTFDAGTTLGMGGGLSYTGTGCAQYRPRLLVDADFSGGPYPLHSDVADVFYVESLAADQVAKIGNGGTSKQRAIIEVSTLGMTGGHSLAIYAADETTLLLTMTATTNSSARWLVLPSGAWRLLGVSDG